MSPVRSFSRIFNHASLLRNIRKPLSQLVDLHLLYTSPTPEGLRHAEHDSSPAESGVMEVDTPNNQIHSELKAAQDANKENTQAPIDKLNCLNTRITPSRKNPLIHRVPLGPLNPYGGPRKLELSQKAKETMDILEEQSRDDTINEILQLLLESERRQANEDKDKAITKLVEKIERLEEKVDHMSKKIEADNNTHTADGHNTRESTKQIVMGNDSHQRRAPRSYPADQQPQPPLSTQQKNITASCSPRPLLPNNHFWGQEKKVSRTGNLNTYGEDT